jgi:hypothetical protein
MIMEKAARVLVEITVSSETSQPVSLLVMLLAAKALARKPARMLPTCIVARNFEGSPIRERIRFA